MARVELDVPHAKVQVPQCPRCTVSHNVEVAQLHRPVVDSRGYSDWTHFFTCPEYDQPVLLKVEAHLEYLPDPEDDDEEEA